MTVEENYKSDKATIDLAIDNMLNTLSNEVITKFHELEQKIENVEKQVATLVLAYGEQAVFMEALIGQIAFSTEEAQKSFHQTLKEARKSMLEVMKDGSETFMAGSDQDLGEALNNLASEKLSDPSQ
jgi:dsDNA-specific endonuclease/ATPase MutS2